MKKKISKSKIVEQVKSKLKTLRHGDFIKEGDFFNLLVDIVSNHYDSKNKVGLGIDHFFVTMCHLNPKNKKFNIRRVDGTQVDFSYKKAIYGNKEPKIAEVKRCFRYIIRPYVTNFRRKYFNENMDNRGYIVCHVTRLKFRIEDCHIDHNPPQTFNKIVADFIKKENVDISKVIIKRNLKDIPIIQNKELLDKFYNYHAKNCDLKCVYYRANVQRLF